MSNAQLILIDKRHQPLKEYLVAVAASDGLAIRGVEIMASPAKGERSLLNAQVMIPPLEPLDFDVKKITHAVLERLMVEEDTYSIEDFIEKCSDDASVQESLRRSLPKLRKKIEAMIKTFCDSEVVGLIQERRNDALYKLKEHADNLKGKKVVCIDIEATHVSTHPDADIIQISACDLEGNELFNQLINPGYDIPENDKHNISTEMVENQPLLAQVWEKIHTTLKEADVVLAYSTESDFMYLEKSAEKKMLPFELDYSHWLDVAELSKDLHGALRWHSEKMYWFYKTPKLTMAYEKVLGQPFPGDAHDALADARATAELFKAMLEKGRKSQIQQKKVAKVKDTVTNNLFAAAFANAKRK